MRSCAHTRTPRRDKIIIEKTILTCLYKAPRWPRLPIGGPRSFNQGSRRQNTNILSSLVAKRFRSKGESHPGFGPSRGEPGLLPRVSTASVWSHYAPDALALLGYTSTRRYR